MISEITSQSFSGYNDNQLYKICPEEEEEEEEIACNSTPISNQGEHNLNFTCTHTHRLPDDVIDKVNNYDTGLWELDKPPEIGELELAFKTKRNGVSFDGLPSDILLILPESLKQVILILMKKIFFGTYPEEWKIQVLYAITKHGHT